MKNHVKLSLPWIALVLLCTPLTSFSLSYQEKKDQDALAAMERTFKRTPMKARLFDGKRIPPETNPVEVRLYVDQVKTALRTAQSSWSNVSKAGRASPKAKQLAEQYDAYHAYATGFSKAYEQFKAQPPPSSQTVQHPRVVVITKTQGLSEEKEAQRQTCKAFRKQLSPQDESKVRFLLNVDNGQALSVGDRDEVIAYRKSYQAVARLCSMPEFNNIQAACQAMTSFGTAPEGAYCAVAAKGEAVLQKAVSNFAVFLAQRYGSADDISVDTLKQRDGWVELQGPVTWATVTSGGKRSDSVLKTLKPLFAEVGLENAEDAQVLANIDARAKKLADVIKTLAPSWTMPGKKCQGPPCEVAERTLQAWYPTGKILKVNQKRSNWRIRQHQATRMPIERYRSGWTLVEVPDDPYCQLRSWTVYEQHQGGGKYQPADGAQIGYVRWQSCS